MITVDEKRFNDVYREVFPVLMKVTYNITGSIDVSEELCQEAFMKYHEKGDHIPDIDQSKYWLIRVVRNMALNYEKRKNKERRIYDKILKETPSSYDPVEKDLLKKETREIVKEALLKIPYKNRIALVLREYGDLNYKEIAKSLNISEGNVKVRIFRAREELGKIIHEGAVYVS